MDSNLFVDSELFALVESSFSWKPSKIRKVYYDPPAVIHNTQELIEALNLNKPFVVSPDDPVFAAKVKKIQEIQLLRPLATAT